MVCLWENLKIGASGATNNSKGRNTPVSSVLWCKATKTLYIGYEDGMITADGIDFIKLESKITGLGENLI